MTVLREGLLEGTAIVVASAAPSDHARATEERCAALGASTTTLAVDHLGEEPPSPASVDVLVYDGAGTFSTAQGVDATRAVLDGAWLAVRAVANAAMIPRDGGKVVLLAPPRGDAHAEAARAGLENLARVASIEWARFHVTTVAIHPGEHTAPHEVADIIAYLASPAGDYASGCVITFR